MKTHAQKSALPNIATVATVGLGLALAIIATAWIVTRWLTLD